MSERTPKATGEYLEPWFRHGDMIYTGEATIHDPGYMTMHTEDTFALLSVDMDAEERGRDDDILDRVVACVNACEGLNPEGVREMWEALKVIATLNNWDEWPDPEDACNQAASIAKAAIAKATPSKEGGEG